MFSVMAAALGAGLSTSGCKKAGSDTDQAQVGDAVGEMMASADESLQGGTTTAMLESAPEMVPVLRMPTELRAPAWRRAMGTLLPTAHAAACSGVAFSSCANGARTRTFASCDIGDATLDGMVTLTFSNATLCAMPTTGDSVTRTADFTLTGPYGGTLQVTSPGGGQTLTRTADGFTYHVGGMERVLTGPAGRTLFDVATDTTSDIVITGSSRSDLVIVSGALEIHHKLAGYTVTLSPSNLTWTPSCNCATSGTLTGSVSGGPNDGKTASVTLNGCGEATVTIGSTTESVTLDRCAPL
jgi:hypothetical protein